MTINQKLTESGEKDRLKELLRAKLIECGWRDELKNYSKGNGFISSAYCCIYVYQPPSPSFSPL
jgi:enhancer of yellow 2 transcription factor